MSAVKHIPQTVLFDKALENFSESRPFVIYKKPESLHLMGLFQKDNLAYKIDNFEETGYVFAPFDGNEILLIPENTSEIITSDWNQAIIPDISIRVASHDDETKSRHISLVEKGIKAISDGQFGKVVLSRKETVALNDFDLIKTFTKLTAYYPNAFVYCWFHPKSGLWLGAFSEQLVKIKGNELTTMSVAGTQVWNEDKIIWAQKERQEQLFVTDFIVDSLKKYSDNITTGTPYTLRAGALAHLKTVIKAILPENTDLKSILHELHPTPAVCGLPKEAARHFIIANEKYNRGYYSGFHGELNKDFFSGEKQTDLFVNLRCMQVEKDENLKAHLYIGGGITIDSNPEKEWLETVNKAQTMRKVLFGINIESK